ncbi:MAG: hypothetical protein NTV72_01440 [Candidatus Taylorbacteria bacterium]|nr:hypothetical protein [Candidatus Taylorbacteria bacterium]
MNAGRGVISLNKNKKANPYSDLKVLFHDLVGQTVHVEYACSERDFTRSGEMAVMNASDAMQFVRKNLFGVSFEVKFDGLLEVVRNGVDTDLKVTAVIDVSLEENTVHLKQAEQLRKDILAGRSSPLESEILFILATLEFRNREGSLISVQPDYLIPQIVDVPLAGRHLFFYLFSASYSFTG